MSLSSIVSKAGRGLVAASVLALCSGPASAFTLSGPSLGPSVGAAQVDKVWYFRWNCGGWHPGWGYHPGFGWQAGWRGPGWQGPGWGGVPLGAVAAGAVVGAAVAVPVYTGPCWQRWIGPYGGVHWRRVC
jgi:hypothetical protein